jgi:SusD family.
MIDDDAYNIPLYHFNRRAAYAFAAQFNLYYGNYKRAAEYATLSIGDNPASSLRNLSGYSQLTSPDEWTIAYLNSTQSCNIMLIVNRSLWGRRYNREYRFGHNRNVATTQTFWSKGPWKGTSVGSLPVYSTVFGTDRVLYIPKCEEMFEVTNQTAQTGQPHVTAYAYTTDETLITRAEAYTLLKEYDKAAADLSTWYLSKGSTSSCSSGTINSYYAQADTATQAKPLHPKFAIEQGKQTNLLQACLHARRIETIHEGKRWLDIRRYGIALQHPLSSGDTLRLSSGDLRYAIQLPDEVILSGLQKNPR